MTAAVLAQVGVDGTVAVRRAAQQLWSRIETTSSEPSGIQPEPGRLALDLEHLLLGRRPASIAHTAWR